MKTVTGGNDWEEFCVVVIFKCVLWERDAFPVCSFKQRSLTHLHWLTDSLSVWLPTLRSWTLAVSPTLGHQVLMTSVIKTGPTQCLEFCFCLFPSVSDSRKTLFYFWSYYPIFVSLFTFYFYVFRSEGVHQSINFLHAIDLNAFMLKIFGISFVYGVRWTSNTCCFFFLCLFSKWN